MAERGGRIVFGIILIMLGVIFFLPNLHLPFLRWDSIWPLFIVLGGSAFLAGWALSAGHDPGLAFLGTGGVLVGAFLALFAWEILPWRAMSVWWPGFPFIGGLAFLVLWAAGHGRDHGALVPACGGLFAGAAGFAATMGYVDWDFIARWWPMLLIVLGLIVLAGRTIGGGRE